MALNLDIDVLRTLVAAQDLGAYNRAAHQVGRSQSAVSQQIRKLELRIGRPLFQKQGRHLVLTEAGETVLAYARRILDLNDEAVAALRGNAVDGIVRFGLPADFAESWLPTVLAHFKREHPNIRIEVTVDRNAALVDRLNRAQLDLAVILDDDVPTNSEPVADIPLAWIGSRDRTGPPGEPVPLAVFDAPCRFRAEAIAALEAAGMTWRIIFSSASLPAVWAAVAAGLGITLRATAGVPKSLAVLGPEAGLPKLSTVGLRVAWVGKDLAPAAQELRQLLRATGPFQGPQPSGTKRAAVSRRPSFGVAADGGLLRAVRVAAR